MTGVHVKCCLVIIILQDVGWVVSLAFKYVCSHGEKAHEQVELFGLAVSAM